MAKNGSIPALIYWNLFEKGKAMKKKSVYNLFEFVFSPCEDDSQDDLETNLSILEEYNGIFGIDLSPIVKKIKKRLELFVV